MIFPSLRVLELNAKGGGYYCHLFFLTVEWKYVLYPALLRDDVCFFFIVSSTMICLLILLCELHRRQTTPHTNSVRVRIFIKVSTLTAFKRKHNRLLADDDDDDDDNDGGAVAQVNSVKSILTRVMTSK